MPPLAPSDHNDDDLDLSSDNYASSEQDTDDAIHDLKKVKSKNTSKRKLRATAPSNFGATLQSLLSTDAPSSLPLSLKPSTSRHKHDEKVQKREKKALQIEKKELEDKGRIRDVIGGWGGESERGLRKVAQRGVVQLFNAIQQSHATAAATAEDAKAGRGSGKPTLAAPTFEKKGKAKGKNKDNILGREKEQAVGKDDFFDMIKSGSIVSRV
ncbi:hypothetical protein AGABI2DRAFT_133366 [Agaricus bisporus var. bisporus H97]|uniref:hypothetical protein n=1 Tax=Agaricus bisporus var. bisporus (strain H97 / ATCC MYA-4626 / FGSC 10389) TaxID=936046 RepID=UPI00029F8025|nr:hypothetical protein AGABI2DRAFT_133366 [Agaricus bisporus var. bisporus H97]EKV51708.1 hypothetical protein AGABI2DRAFT_133366 [Agaricus bisporus var. bisporus H97]